ncbi:hypothetical protein Naga_102058g1, partial [Nannochloropsis gaditana]
GGREGGREGGRVVMPRDEVVLEAFPCVRMMNRDEGLPQGEREGRGGRGGTRGGSDGNGGGRGRGVLLLTSHRLLLFPYAPPTSLWMEGDEARMQMETGGSRDRRRGGRGGGGGGGGRKGGERTMSVPLPWQIPLASIQHLTILPSRFISPSPSRRPGPWRKAEGKREGGRGERGRGGGGGGGKREDGRKGVKGEREDRLEVHSNQWSHPIPAPPSSPPSASGPSLPSSFPPPSSLIGSDKEEEDQRPPLAILEVSSKEYRRPKCIFFFHSVDLLESMMDLEVREKEREGEEAAGDKKEGVEDVVR